MHNNTSELIKVNDDDIINATCAGEANDTLSSKAF